MSEPQIVLPLLTYQYVWKTCVTQKFEFESIFKVDDARTLEGARELSGLRKAGLEVRDGDIVEQIKRLEKYRIALLNLTTLKDEELKDEYKQSAVFQWTSPLAMMDSVFIRVPGFELEMMMVLFLYGCALREKGYAYACEMTGDGKLSASDVVVVFREAAGVFKYLVEVVHIKYTESLPASRPAEMVPAMSSCFEQICLAEAQTIFAHRAAEKGTSPGVVASLHMGASDLFENAAKKLRENTGQFNTINDTIRRFIAISSSLHVCHAYQYMAKEQQAQGQAGKAVRCCQEAQAQLRRSLEVAEGNLQWVSVLSMENQAMKKLMADCDGERRQVYFQNIAQTCPNLVEGKVLAKPIAYEPADHISKSSVMT